MYQPPRKARHPPTTIREKGRGCTAFEGGLKSVMPNDTGIRNKIENRIYQALVE